MKQRFGWLIAFAIVSGCSSQKYLSTQVGLAEKDFQDHIGFVLYDPSGHKVLCDYQGDRYFAPASNTKIFTLYASLLLLGDSVPALRYVQRGDSLIFWGTGNPGFLYKQNLLSTRAYDFLKTKSSRLFFSSANFQTEHFGPGWAWDDYQYTFQVERTPFPLYGNRAKVIKEGGEFVSRPASFDPTRVESVSGGGIKREINSNTILATPGKVNGREWEMPLHFSDEMLAKLLSDTLGRTVGTLTTCITREARTFYDGTPDSLYKMMMQESDNFIAEQLLLMCAGVVSDTLKPEIAIRHVRNQYLSDLSDAPVWVDGSGLSRYNLFTPRSIVQVWEKIMQKVPTERLHSLLAVGGESGTLRNYYKAEKPYIFGKTGTFSNNHTLSGYLVTKQERTLIFSWMNNNFTAPNNAVRARMESILKKIYEKY